MHVFLFVMSVFVCRIQLRRLQNAMFVDDRLTKIGTITCLMLPTLSFLVSSAFIIAIILLVHHVLISSLAQITNWMKLRKAQQQRLSAITKIILHMQLGHSLRSSMQALARNEKDVFWKLQWERMGEIVAFSPQEMHHVPVILRKFVEDLVRCDQNSFGQIDRLSEIREFYHKEFDFRRRSGQSLLQLRMQAIILFGLHLAVSAFMIHQFTWSTHKLIYIFSFLLMSLGVCVLLLMGKGVKWKT